MTSATGVLATLGRGHHDDGGEGILRTKADMAGLVPVSFKGLRGYTFNPLSGGASTTSPQLNGNVYGAPMGTPGAYVGQLPISLKYDGALLTCRFSGRRVGILASAGGFNPPFMDAMVDGVLVTEGDLAIRDSFQVSSAVIDIGLAYPIADDLPDDGPHILQVLFSPSPTLATTVYWFGLMLEERMGYRMLPPQLDMPSAASGTLALTTAYQFLTAVNSLGGIDRIHLSNTDTVSHDVTMAFSDNTIYGTYTVPAAGVAGKAGVADVILGSRPVGSPALKAKLEATPGSGAVTSFLVQAA